MFSRHPNGNPNENGRGYQQNGEHIPRSSYADRTYSLPRTNLNQQPSQTPGYYTQDRRSRSRDNEVNSGAASSAGTDTPDFYFMPSQRKYSGEVVRVYVDYNKDPRK